MTCKQAHPLEGGKGTQPKLDVLKSDFDLAVFLVVVLPAAVLSLCQAGSGTRSTSRAAPALAPRLAFSGPMTTCMIIACQQRRRVAQVQAQA